ncbi:MAG: hypothetical protein NT007_05205 [Candidatus Kapabacteria bacterium]|nr:hypothetical protein [Candidatus Kapabacteria bacterium]
MKRSVLFLSIFVFAAFIFAACNKTTNPTDTTDDNVQSTEDNALVDGEFSSIFSYADAQGNISYSQAQKQSGNEIQSPTTKADLLPSCATVNVDTVNKIMTIDFGSTNCLCRDGNYRRGVVTATLTGKWKSVGAKLVITLANYYVNDNLVQGKKTITISSSTEWQVKVENASVTTATGVVSWNANRQFEKIAGANTPNIAIDDVYLITGTCTGVNRKGVNFTVVTSTPLKKDMSCKFKDFVSGILTIVNLDKGVSLSIDYNATGNEACDKLAKVTIGTKTYTIHLR